MGLFGKIMDVLTANEISNMTGGVEGGLAYLYAKDKIEETVKKMDEELEKERKSEEKKRKQLENKQIKKLEAENKKLRIELEKQREIEQTKIELAKIKEEINEKEKEIENLSLDNNDFIYDVTVDGVVYHLNQKEYNQFIVRYKEVVETINDAINNIKNI